MIQEISIETSEDLLLKINQLPNNYIFRGQTNSLWKLESTLERVIGTPWDQEKAKKFEELSLIRFQSKYSIYKQNEILPNSKLSWLSMMQHYGVPTRLLDFTESPYIALYFILETYNFQSNTNFSIYAIDYTKIIDNSISIITDSGQQFPCERNEITKKSDEIFDFLDQNNYDILWVTEPLILNERIDRQSGSFLISINKSTTIESLINTGLYDDCIIKYTIDYNLYESIYALLRKMNINSKLLYGDLAGLSKSIKMELQVYS